MNSLYHYFAEKIKRLPIIQKHPELKELIKYSVVGNTSNFIDLLLYIYLTRAFSFWQEHYLTANLFAMLIASIVRFVFHKHWTFRNTSLFVKTQYAKFILVMFLGLIINEVVLYITVEHGGFNDLIGKLASLAVTTLFAYYFTKFWVFQKD